MKIGELELVHFQLTRNCNLRCWFCGQWGKKGFFRDAGGRELAYSDWMRLAGELEACCPEKPSIILWGGEPLMYPRFDDLCSELHRMGFPLGMVTNGTLLDRHAEICGSCFRRIYLSVDGPEDVHDSIRGAGAYEKVLRNTRLLKGAGAKVTLMTVLTPPVLERLPETLDAFREFDPHEVLLQERIALSPGEIDAYKRWLSEHFHQRAEEITAWEGTLPDASGHGRVIRELLENHSWPFTVTYLPHGEVWGKTCDSPKHHAHIAWNGNVLFCTDFYDFSPGNVREKPLAEILQNDLSERFAAEIAKGACPTCEHCSWRGSRSFRLE